MILIDDPRGPCVIATRPTARAHARRKFGKIRKGLYFCHTCDRGECRNVGHIWIGTPKDNSQDAVKKGRAVAPPVHRGLNHHLARITRIQAAEIRNWYRVSRIGPTRRYGTISKRDLARRYRVSLSTIKRILSGEHYA